MPDSVRVALTIAAGFVTGILSGMFGIGGAVISNPSLRALGAPPLTTIGSTLPSIIPSAISGSLRYHRDRLLRWSVIRWVGPTGALCSIGGALLSDLVPGDGHLLTMTIALLMGYTSIRLMRKRATAPHAAEAELEMAVERDTASGPPHEDVWRLLVVGAGAGLFSGLLGIGGGLLMVPLFSGWLKIPLKETIGTSLACVAMIAVPGMITHAAQGHIDWSYALPLALGVIPGAWLGANITIGTSERRLQLMVGGALGILAAVYAAEELYALISS